MWFWVLESIQISLCVSAPLREDWIGCLAQRRRGAEAQSFLLWERNCWRGLGVLVVVVLGLGIYSDQPLRLRVSARGLDWMSRAEAQRRRVFMVGGIGSVGRGGGDVVLGLGI